MGSLKHRLNAAKNNWLPTARVEVPEVEDGFYIHVKSMSIALRDRLVDLQQRNAGQDRIIAPLQALQMAGETTHPETGESVAALIKRYDDERPTVEQFAALHNDIIVETACDEDGIQAFDDLEELKAADLPAALMVRLASGAMSASVGTNAGNDPNG